jgi:dipeptidyl aminopeptidase/acylaminoacyl peptidase
MGQRAPEASTDVPLIPREVLFGNPERTSPQLSPDGQRLAYLAPDDRGVMQVWVRTLGAGDDRCVTADRKRGIRMYLWAYDGRQLVYLQDAEGDENWHLHGVDVTGGIVRDLTPFQGAQARVSAVDPDFPDEMLVELNLRDERLHDVFHVNLRNGAVEPVAQNPGHFLAWEADASFHVRAAMAGRGDGGFDLMVRDADGGGWRKVIEWAPDDTGHIVTFSKDSRTLLIRSSHDADTDRLVAIDLAGGGQTTVAADEEVDVGGLFIHPVTRRVQAVGFYRDRLAWRVLDEAVRADFEAIAKIRRGEFKVTGGDLADRTWIVTYNTDDGPVHYYAYDRATRTATLLFTDRPKLEGLPLARMEPVGLAARDGLTLHGYLTRPTCAAGGGEKPPAVLLVHGGPWGRDTWGFQPGVQWLANRGYAVLQVNFRGSAGYGKAFLNAGNREWAGKMHDDLIDGVRWLVDGGHADPKRIAIFGGSYGGYATLVGLTFTPEVFACGVDLVGPSNLLTLLRNAPPYWMPFLPVLHYRVGDVERDREFLRSRSPLFHADRICRPLLIGQGANDPRVKQSESDQIVAAMREAKLPVEYVVYADEGHGFARPANRLHFFARAEQFLAKHLGGRAQPVGEIEGHSGEER